MTDKDEAKLQFVRGATKAMAEATFGCICSVVSVESADRGRFVGTGFRVSNAGKLWLVTAEHVAKQANLAGKMAVTHMRGQPPIFLESVPRVDPSNDLIAFSLSDEVDEAMAWPLSQLDPDKGRTREDFLVVHGFPNQSVRFTSLLQALIAKSLPYGAMMREDQLPSDLRSSQFAMDFHPQNLQSLGGEQDPWQRPHGLSGSPVWRIGVVESDADEWSPSHARLVGGLTEWRSKNHLLVGSSVSALAQLLR